MKFYQNPPLFSVVDAAAELTLEETEVWNIWFLSPLVPSKREKNIQTENLVCLNLYIF